MEWLFEKQKDFQKKLGNIVSNQDFRNEMFLGLISEVIEVMNETKWKKHKQNQNFDRTKFIEEIVDCQLYLVNLLLSANVDYKEFNEAFIEKVRINFERQNNDY